MPIILIGYFLQSVGYFVATPPIATKPRFNDGNSIVEQIKITAQRTVAKR